MGERDWRGDSFRKLLYAFCPYLPHTYVRGFDATYTCVTNGRSYPKQNDYMATTAPRRYIVQAKVAEATSALPGHWPLSLGLLPRKRCAQNSRGETSRITNLLGGS